MKDMAPAQIDEIWFPLMERTEREQRAFAATHCYCKARATVKVESTITVDGRKRSRFVSRCDAHATTEIVGEVRFTTRVFSETAAIDAEVKLAECWAAEAPFQAEWDRRGEWVRYPHVITTIGGHYHRDKHCSTCYPTTQYVLVAAVSGLTEAEMVEAVGHHACSVCFPWAPTTTAWGRTIREEADALAARKAEKKAAARAKLAKKVRLAKERHARAVAKVDDGYKVYEIERCVDDIARAERELAYWDSKNPGYSEAAA